MLVRVGLTRWLHSPRLVCAASRAVDRLARRQGLTLILVGLLGFLASAAF